MFVFTAIVVFACLLNVLAWIETLFKVNALLDKLMPSTIMAEFFNGALCQIR